MANLTIRDLDEDVKQALREIAAKKGRSMEAEARLALKAHVAAENPKQSLGALFGELFPHDLRGDIDFGDRSDARPAPRFE